MLKAEQIPDEVVKAFEDEYRFGEGDWKRNSIAAALNAWPGMWVEQLYPLPVDTQGIILPLPQEKA